MRKATLIVGRGFEIGTEPVPQPGPGEVRVQVRACGVCQTEVHAIDGSLARPDIPGMMGHEFSGEVVALGADVTGLEIGTPVACLSRGGYGEQVVVSRRPALSAAGRCARAARRVRRAAGVHCRRCRERRGADGCSRPAHRRRTDGGC